ncbi:MAG: Crp/Fnr family transcriptional regulator [Rikenellaceae bacterium]
MDNLAFNFFCTSCAKDSGYRRANCFVAHKIRRFAKGEYISYTGDVARNLSMLVEGRVRTEIELASGISYVSREHSAPYPFGALALFAHDQRYRASFVAVEDCVVIEVGRAAVEQQMVECRTFMRNFIAYNTTRFDIFSRHLAVLTHKGLKSRVAFYIVTKAQRDGQFELGMTLEALATYLATERPSLSRAIAGMVQEGVIAYGRGRGRVLDWEAIKRFVE